MFSLILRLFYATSGFLLTFLLSSKMTVSDFAKFNIYASIISVVMPILAMGSGNFLLRTANMDVNKKTNRFSLIYIYYLYFMIFLIVVYAVNLFFRFFDDVYFYLFFISLLNVFLFICSEYFRSESKFTVAFIFGNGVSSTSIISQGALISFLFLFLVFLNSDLNLLDIFYMIIFFNIILILCCFYYFSRKGFLKIKKINRAFRWYRIFTLQGLSFSIMGIVFAVMASQELWALSLSSNPNEISVYSLIVRISAIPMVIFTIAASYAQVFFINFYKTKNIIYRNKIVKISIFCFLSLTAFCLLLLFFSNNFICDLSFNRYCGFDANVLYIKILGVWFYCLMGFSASFLIALSDTHSVVKYALLSIFIFWCTFLLSPLDGDLYKVSFSIFLSNSIYSLLLWKKIKDKIDCSFDLFSNLKWMLNK